MSANSSSEAMLASPERNAAAWRFGCCASVSNDDALANMVRATNASHLTESRMCDFFDPHDLTQVKYEMLRRVRTERQSVTKASAMFGVSRPTFYKAQTDFDRNGLAGLLPAKRGPRQPHKITPEVARFIQETVASGDDVNATRLAKHITERFGLVVHQRTVKRALARLKKKAR